MGLEARDGKAFAIPANDPVPLGRAGPDRLRVLHIVRQFAPSTGGLETYVDELASRQAGRFDVTVLTLDRVFGQPERLASRESGRGYTVERIPFVGARRLFAPLLPRARLEGYDVIHVHAADQLLDLVALHAPRLKARLFMTTHGLFFHTEAFARAKRAYLRLITRRSLARCRAVFAVSGNDAATLSGVGVEAVLLRNPVVPIGSFLCEGRDLLYVGRLSANKRIDALIAFMDALRAHRPDAVLHLVGGDGEGLWPALRREVERRGLEARVRYHGFVEPAALRDLARRCGFVVSASRYEGYGLAVVEGMSVGLVPFVHANAAFRETLDLSGCGRLADFDDPQAAARDFAAWADGVTIADRLRAARFAHAQTWDAVCERYETHYRGE